MKYELLDSGDFRKLEQIGPHRLIRPALGASWEPQRPSADWQGAHLEFRRRSDGGGDWLKKDSFPEEWEVVFHGIKLALKCTSFGHLGVFPEQEPNWLRIENWVKMRSQRGASTSALNLFGYTGAASLFAARAGAEVTHVDASRGTIKWAQQNALSNGIESMRFFTDDVKEFLAREIRRGHIYDLVILDPPSFGRGEKKRVWKIESDLFPLLKDLKKLLSPEESLICLSAHSEGFGPLALENQLRGALGKGESLESTEMWVPDTQGVLLPSGASALWRGTPVN